VRSNSFSYKQGRRLVIHFLYFFYIFLNPVFLSGAAHIAIPSTEQEKLDREWEYFETVCDQVFFILVSIVGSDVEKQKV